MAVQPPPTYADVVLVNKMTKKAAFNPVWLNWFLSLSQLIDENALGGDVVGPAVAVADNIALFDGVTGKLLKDSGKAVPAGTIAGSNNNLSFFAATTSLQLAGVISDETGSGALVFATSPTFVTPILGTPTSGTLTNCTIPVGGVTGLGANVATFLVTPSSANLASAVTDETGTGALVFANTPSLVTPAIGAATGTSLAATGALTSSGTAGVGYAAGAGGTVTQTTDKSTAVTLDKICGEITMDAAALAATTIVSFTLNNSTIAATDNMILNHVSGGTAGAYTLNAQPAAGSASINVRNGTVGVLSEAIVIRFTVIKAVTS